MRILAILVTTCTISTAMLNAAPNQAQALLKSLCHDCHGSEKQKGDLRLDQLSTDHASAETWHDVLDQLNRGEMPPKKATQPTAEQLATLTSWLDKLLADAAAAKRLEKGRLQVRRMTRYEYANTMRDLLNLEYDYAKELPPEPASADGFLNNGTTLELSPSQLDTYLKIARQALEITIPDPTIKKKLIEVSQTKTAKGNLPNSKAGNQLPASPEYIIDLPKFPRVGDFEIEVTARLANPNNAALPKIEVSLGHIPGIIHVPRKTVGTAELTQANTSQTFRFRGRMEDFPQAGDIPFGRSGFKGMIGMIDFIDADGKPLSYPDRSYAQLPQKPKKGKKPKPAKQEKPFGSRLDIKIESAIYRGPLPRQSLLASDDPLKEIRRFANRAFRRPVSAAELVPFEKLYLTLCNKQFTHLEAMREVFSAILVSPHFLYLPAETNSDYDLASRLSYFLWSSMPDAQLLKLAKEGKLSKRFILVEQIKRLLADQKSEQFVNHFTDQWLELDGLERVAINPSHYPKFNNSLKHDFRSETRMVFREILQQNISALELIDSNWTMANRSLARHYKIDPLPKTNAFKKVVFPASSPRGGLLGQASFALIGSDGEQPHPIKRAVWILDRLLDDPPGSPPPDTPELDSENPDFAKLSLKQQLEAHRKKESCRNCHAGIDPWGIPLENFDAIGSWKKHTNTSANLPDGTLLTNAKTLKQYIKTERQRWFGRSIVKRLSTFAIGRSLDIGDRETIEQLTNQFVENDFRLQNLIIDLVDSELFRHNR